MKQKRFIDASNAFQTGLDHNPDDADLKKAYMEAVTLAEKSPSKDSHGSFDKRMMGMMMHLRNYSWVYCHQLFSIFTVFKYSGHRT